MWIFVALIVVPLIEIGLFIQVGGWIGLFPTLVTVIFTAVLGAALLRRQGMGELAKLQASLNEGRDPRGPLAHGALILVAGIVLLTPGFFTDAIGFALLVPPIRSAVIGYLTKRIVSNIHMQAGAATADRHPPASEDIIDGDYRVEPEDIPDDGPRGSSGWTRRD
jgi:UPF0716 protein FxsA